VVRHGDWTLLEPDHPQVFAYRRALGDERVAVFANFSAEPAQAEVPPELRGAARDLIADAAAAVPPVLELAPWESRALYVRG